MKLKLSIGGLGADEDVMITADAAATVGDLAAEIAARVEVASALDGDVTIRVHGLPTESASSSPVLLDPHAPIGESALPSGTRVTLASAAELFDAAGHRRGDAKALLRIHSGPDAGREFNLPSGSTQVGRDVSSDVQLSDSFVSKRHIRISVTDMIEVIDLGSANGTTIAGEQVQRAEVRPDELVEIGDTVLTIAPLSRLKGGGHATVGFNRSPVVQRIFGAREIDAPEPPGPVRPSRFPIIAMAGPLLVAGAMFFVTKLAKQNVSPVMFVMLALSPLLMVGAFVDQRRQARSEAKEADAQFADSVAGMRAELERLGEEERLSRYAEAPSAVDSLTATEELGRLLWSRRVDRPGFLDVRLGIGRVTSRTTIKLPHSRRSKAADWERLVELQRDFSTIDAVPVVASLTDAGGLGIAGPVDVMSDVARGLVAQIACLHSPSEVAIAAVGSTLTVSGWDWLKWLPHVGSPHSPLKDLSLADSATTAAKLVAQLEELCAERAEGLSAGGAAPAPLPRIVLIVMDDAPIDRSRLVSLAETGPQVGVHVLWCAGSVSQVPAACRSFVELDEAGRAESGQVHLSEIVDPIRCESLALDVAGHLARRLAPVVDAGARVEDDSDLPRTVSFLASMGTDLGRSPQSVTERWTANDPTLVGGAVPKGGYSLRAVVGQSAGDAFALDLRTHGPHALVGGTTGSGKSEFLQSWVLALAASQSPQRVTFLFVDYKGGSAFARCTELPHCVGLVTDLDQHLVRRALTSLRAELTYREEVLATHRAKDIIDLEKKPDAPQLPSLLIVVDEFAALAQEIPEFVDGVIDVAQRGRSLGLHLILATQRPSGVIKGNLRANTNLRVALRMADSDDSVDVLGDAMSAGFDPAIPGRAAAKTGPGRITVFQSLYVGGSTPDVAPRPALDVETLSFGVPRLLAAAADESPEAAGPEPETDLNRTVDQIISAARVLELASPRKPWLPVLAPVYDLTQIPQRTDTELVLGMQDVPHEQSNRLVHFRPDTDGNMAVIGTGGSGKSTVLRTLGVAAAGTMRGGPCDVYALDFGSRGLSMLADLPHVGAVISGSDHERVGRLLRWLRDEVDGRARRYAAASASTVTEFRERTGEHDERRILVLLDGLPAFRQEYELGPRSAYYTLFGQLAADGRAVGIHFIVTADRPGAIPASLAATIQRRLILRLSDQNDYALAGVPSDVLSAESPPGRGIIDGLETQIAVLGASASLPRQAEETAQLAQALTARGRVRARPIERLAERITLSELPAQRGGRVVVGISDEDLEPFAVAPHGSFLVVGPPGSGRTTALATLVRACRRSSPQAQTFLFGTRRTVLRNVDAWGDVALGDDEIGVLAMDLGGRLQSGALAASDARPVVIVIEGIDALASTPSEASLEGLVKTALDHGAFVVGESEVSALGNAYMLGNAFKAGRRGMALQPDDMDGQTAFKQQFPRTNRSEFPPGRGMVVDAGRAERVQLCLPE
ncbi:FtsK/SpoIIIE domain-containing protein [Aeromicrobium fastidiosum]|uniref:FHA domain-containing protein n=1 Tax=Aeromicrobium fastidiosum TaxID=52699 RepID=A0A641ALT5_9ACTN|nr:FtsK/SpoIIIE domain-containing protein [Aeromicrobium fastidiosum]KAA1374681.1 FHA domain-containing protein [Aeromicrobium fastidiosum]MBP2390772.1 S-DNA-T family DNA segregation ATPase FtsK/SpoIIIE [Aeromicrobium fastidiosum]